jgi:uncharacterized protein YndB with AHSA1/START domain
MEAGMWQYELSIETLASPDAVWQLWSDIARWPEWNEGIEKITIDGPFAAGTTVTMTAPGEDEPVRLRRAEIVPGELFADEMAADGFAVRTEHRLDPAGGGTRITYRTRISGPAADQVGPELGPAITADFPQVLSALARLAERGA